MLPWNLWDFDLPPKRSSAFGKLRELVGEIMYAYAIHNFQITSHLFLIYESTDRSTLIVRPVIFDMTSMLNFYWWDSEIFEPHHACSYLSFFWYAHDNTQICTAYTTSTSSGGVIAGNGTGNIPPTSGFTSSFISYTVTVTKFGEGNYKDLL